MSIKYMDRVWATHGLKGGPLLLMLAIADHANDAGECWPSQRHLAEKARLTERQVRRVIGQLIRDEYLAISERGLGRGKKTLYKLFPQKADIFSGHQKADIRDIKKRTFSTEISGHLPPPKADNSDGISSHVRSESPLEPSNGNGIIPSCDFDFWSQALAELLATSSSGLVNKYLAGSTAHLAGRIDGVPVYRVTIEERHAAGVDWLVKQAGFAIRTRLTSLLGHPVQIEIVAAEREPVP